MNSGTLASSGTYGLKCGRPGRLFFGHGSSAAVFAGRVVSDGARGSYKAARVPGQTQAPGEGYTRRDHDRVRRLALLGWLLSLCRGSGRCPGLGVRRSSQYEQQYGTARRGVALGPRRRAGCRLRRAGRQDQGQPGDGHHPRGAASTSFATTSATASLIAPVREIAGDPGIRGAEDGRQGARGDRRLRLGPVSSRTASQIGGYIQFWKYLGPPEETEKAVTAAPTLTLEALVTRPDKQEGQPVRVVGQFRGRNLFGDLPGFEREKPLRLGDQGRPLRHLGHGEEAEGERVGARRRP